MPYVKPERREVVDSFKGEYGDLVYYYYKILVEHWNFMPSFSRFFQMKYLIPSQSEFVDGDIVNSLMAKDTMTLKVPESLQSIARFKCSAYWCAVDELKRRYVDKYEDQKLKENGDVE